MIDLHDLSYLRRGTSRQQDAYRAITDLRIFQDLARYTPALAGTVPLEVDVEESDLDIICCAPCLKEFLDLVMSLYGRQVGFDCQLTSSRGVASAIARFHYAGWRFELFAQNVPVAQQYACLHLLAESRLLEQAGASAREGIRALKRQGWKTEPAFAQYFGLQGDPYEALARLAREQSAS